MNTASRVLSLPLTIVVALGIAVALGGCSSGPTGTPGDPGTREVVETETETTNDTTQASGTKDAAIPADFPSVVPLVEGTVTYGGSILVNGSMTWTLLLTVSDVRGTYNRMVDQLEAAGFVKGMATDGDESAGGFFDGNGYNLIVSVAKKGDSFEAGYVVNEDVK